MLKLILPQGRLLFLKVNSGPSHMTCLPRRDSSEALVKETCLFHSRDGDISTLLILMLTVQQSGSVVTIIHSYSDDVLVEPWRTCRVYSLSNTMRSQLIVV